MNKNAKSRIPVPVKQKLPIQQTCSDKKSFQTGNNLHNNLKKQTFGTNKTVQMQLIQKKTEKKIFSEVEKSKKEKVVNYPKNKQTSLKTSTKCSSSKILKSNNNKLITRGSNIKPNLQNKEAFNVKKDNEDKRKFPKIEIECSDDLIEVNKENLPSPKSHPFEIEEKFVSKQDCFPANENVEFEANELYRKMILTNNLSPSMCKLLPNVRLSSFQSERPSIYQKFEIPNDPFQEVLKALKNTSLSVKRIKKENIPSSPYKERSSIYTPYRDLNAEYHKGLEDFKRKQLQNSVSKSNKKVTFNLNVQECTPISTTCDIKKDLLKNSEYKLMQISEKSEENTPNLLQNKEQDEIKVNIVSEHEPISNERINIDNTANVMKLNNKNIVQHIEPNETKELPQSDTILKSNQRTIVDITPDYKLLRLSGKTSKVINYPCWNSSPDFDYVTKKNKCNANAAIYVQEVRNVLASEHKKTKNTNAKIYTPKPISFSVKSEINQNYSPEFIVSEKSKGMTNLAPICTPLVLRSQAKNVIFSPEQDDGPEPNEGLIPLKLDFTEVEKNTPKREICKSLSSVLLDNIVTNKEKLDILADQECYLSLLHENFPVIQGRYLTNPVAETLSEGDDMHFIPVRL